MKLLRPLFFLGLAVMPVSASDIAQNRAEEIGKTYQVYGASNGQVYRDVTVTKITDAGITLMHADGSLRLRYEQLTVEQREKFGITKEGAEAIYAKEMKARAAHEAQVAEMQKERQKAHEELLAKHTAAHLEAERLMAERLKAQKAEGSELAQVQEQADATETTSIVSAIEVPHFPIIRGYDNQILYPIQNTSRRYRSSHYGSGTTYPVYYGGTHGYPSCGSYYRPSHHRGSWGWINYRRGNFNFRLRW